LENLNSARTAGQEGPPDRVVILASVVNQFSRNLAAPGHPDGIHQRCIPHMLGHLGGTFFQEELNKVELVTLFRSMPCARAFRRVGIR
jgi:hypothetical protein